MARTKVKDIIKKEKKKNTERKSNIPNNVMENNVVQTADLDVDEGVIIGMANEVEAICSQLNNELCNVEDVYKAIHKYIGKHERILYSAISNFIFAEQERKATKVSKEEDGNELILLLKVEELVACAYKKGNSEMQGICTKIYDHANLAIRQYSVLKQSSDEYKKQFEVNIEPFKNKLMKDMNGQLISLVSIFTALAFLIFGGISSLDNVFTQETDISILKLIILGCVWGLAIINLVFIFLFCIGKMTDFSFKSTDKLDASLLEKYPIVWFSNLLLVMTLICAGILYYIDQFNIGFWFVEWTKSNAVFFIPVVFIFLAFLFGLCLYAIFRKRK